jgi:hypothetical protein
VLKREVEIPKNTEIPAPKTCAGFLSFAGWVFWKNVIFFGFFGKKTKIHIANQICRRNTYKKSTDLATYTFHQTFCRHWFVPPPPASQFEREPQH